MIYNIKEFLISKNDYVDCTGAIQKAIDKACKDGGGTVYIPPGKYTCSSIKLKSFVTLIGNSSFSYAEKENYNGSTVLYPSSNNQNCLLDLTGCLGTKVIGLTLDGKRVGNKIHGIYSKHNKIPQNISFEDLKVWNFTGSGIRLDHCWVWAVRKCIIMDNLCNGIDISSSYDGWIIDNQITANKNSGIFSDEIGCSTITTTANRIEWNEGGGILILKGGDIQINGTCFDRNFGPGVKLLNCRTFTLTGNIFRRNGFKRENTEDSCHIFMENCQGVCVTGNSFFGGNHPADHKFPDRPASPSYGIVYGKLNECLINSNCLYHSALKEVFVDMGENHSTDISNNTYSLQSKNGLF